MKTYTRALLASATALAGLMIVQSPPASASALVSESFRGASTAPGWEMESPQGAHTPCLTAAKAPVAGGSLPACNTGPSDAPGQGVFQLTDNATDDGGNLLYDKAISATAGLNVSFDFFQYRTTTAKGADGISFFLIDGEQQDITAGETGGMLGYKGLKGALVGIGFDQYGNFSNPNCVAGKTDSCGKGGPGKRPNSVAVRGAEATGFQYVAGDASPGLLAVDKATRRDEARRTASISLSSTGRLNVAVDFHDGRGSVAVLREINLNAIEGQPKLPPTIKLGFSASTGGATNYHEIRDFALTSLDPKLSVTAAGESTVKAGGKGKVALKVGNKADAGPTTGAVEVTYGMPAVYKTLPGFTIDSAAGSGWSCQVRGEEVSCTRPGSAADALSPGSSYPDIEVSYSAGGKIFRDAPTSVKVTSPQSPEVTATLPISVASSASGPDLTTVIKHDGTPLAGGRLTYQLTVSNKAEAGPTSGVTTAGFTAPDGTTIESVTPGTGWSCKQLGQDVTCTCENALQPGSAHPPIEVTVILPGDSSGATLTPTGNVNTDGDTNTDNNNAPADTSTLSTRPPALSAVITHDGTPVEGGITTYHLVVANGAGTGLEEPVDEATPGSEVPVDDYGPGPTTGTVTTTFVAPTGSTVVSATGDGWTCTTSGQTVTCTRPGTGGDALMPGSVYPPVNVDVRWPAGVPYTATVTATGTVAIGGTTTEATPDETAVTKPPADVRTGVLVTAETDPGSFVPGKPFVYKVTVTNAGPSDAKGVPIDVALPLIWQKIAWKCTASAGSSCPVLGGDLPLTGSLATTLDVAAGGSVVLTVGCVIPADYTSPMELTLTYAPPAGAIDSNCTTGSCTGKVITKPLAYGG